MVMSVYGFAENPFLKCSVVRESTLNLVHLHSVADHMRGAHMHPSSDVIWLAGSVLSNAELWGALADPAIGEGAAPTHVPVQVVASDTFVIRTLSCTVSWRTPPPHVSEDGRYLLCCCGDDTLRIIDMNQKSIFKTLRCA